MELADVENIVRRMLLDAAAAAPAMPVPDGGRVGQDATQGVNASFRTPQPWPAEAGAASATPGSFEMTLTAGTATFVNCILQRQYCFISHADLTASVSESGTVWVGVEYTEATGAMAIITGAALTDVSYATRQADESVIRLALYKLTDGAIVWDGRKTPQAGLYI